MNHKLLTQMGMRSRLEMARYKARLVRTLHSSSSNIVSKMSVPILLKIIFVYVRFRLGWGML
jgi:hypothetical protein